MRALVLLIILIVILLALPLNGSAENQATRRAFPVHVQYAAGTIKPSNVSRQQMDDFVRALYDKWKSRFLIKACAPGEYYVWFDENPGEAGVAPNTLSVSEEMGYGMEICAFMAGYDPGARTYFDGLYRFFKSNRSANSAYLMGWNQVVGCANAPDGGNSTATDGDLDIAYALLLADRQWGSSGTVNYMAEAQSMINAIKLYEINLDLHSVLIGDWAMYNLTTAASTRPADFMTEHFKCFSQASGDTATWNGVTDQCYAITNTLQSTYARSTGLVPDFANGLKAAIRPSLSPNTGNGTDGKYSANASRVPWRLGLDYLINGDPRAFNALSRINKWLRSAAHNSPSKIRAGYSLNGKPINRDWNTIYFTAPFAVSAMIDARNQQWLNDLWTWMTKFDYSREHCYANSIGLLNAIVISGNWWSPGANLPQAAVGEEAHRLSAKGN